MRYVAYGWNLALLAVSGVGLLLAIGCAGASSPESAGPGSKTLSSSAAGSAADTYLPESSGTGDIQSPDARETSVPATGLTPAVHDPSLSTAQSQPEATGNPPGQESTAVPLPAIFERPAPIAPVGTEVGDRVPDFTLKLLDGGTLTSTDLVGRNQPAFLFFHATW